MPCHCGLIRLIGFCVLLSSVNSDSGPEVAIGAGHVVGVVQQTYNGRPIRSFLGIPYAQPPVGKLRFKDPVPFEFPRGQKYTATRYPNICHHTPERKGQEDCLYLNVFTPAVPVTKGPLDVIVVIHGGAFQFGHGHLHGPEYLLAKHDVVMVSFNYRLGVLGFLSLEDDVLPGNMGLKDQNLALKWVKKNIAAFGGDPDKITLLGCSAGAVSVHFHILSPLSKGLFQKAILMSGSALSPFAIVRSPKTRGLQVAKHVGCHSDDVKEIVECLRSKPAEELSNSPNELFVKFLGFNVMAINPVIEKSSPNAFLTRDPEEIIRSGEYNDVPMIFGYTNDECLFYSAEIFTNASLAAELESKWEELLPICLTYSVKNENKHSVAKKIKDFYIGDKHLVDAYEELTKLFSERYLSVGIRKAAKLHAKNGSPVHSYVFTHTGGKRLSDHFNHSDIYKGGAVHADDFFYVLKTDDYHKIVDNAPQEEAMAQYLISLVVQFAKESPPKKWETVKSGLPHFKYLEISSPKESENSMKTMDDSSAEHFWKSLELEETGRKTFRETAEL